MNHINHLTIYNITKDITLSIRTSYKTTSHNTNITYHVKQYHITQHHMKYYSSYMTQHIIIKYQITHNKITSQNNIK